MQLPIRTLFLASLAAAGLGMAAAARAQDSADSKKDAAAVRAAAKDYLAAIRRGDVDAQRNLWTPDGDYVDASGRKFKAREVISQQSATTPPSSRIADASGPESTLRFIAPDVAIEDGISGRGRADDGGIVTGQFTALWVKRDGRWQLDALREAVAASLPGNEHLQSLEWLIGEWLGATDDGAILVSSHWSDDGHYIVREFVERGDGREPVSGTQRIGWDAAASKIKCWTFDSQGGAGEGSWRRDGNRWIVETTDVLADGKKATTSAVYIPGGEGRFVWEAAGAKVGEVSLPPRRVEFKRAAEGD